jgi:plasmid maintenance system antidote protein VapI
MITDPSTPWRRVVARLGMSPAALAAQMGRHRSKITRAVNDPEGLISGRDQKVLKQVAARIGVALDPADLVS